MKPIIIGGLVAVAIIIAFAAGSLFQESNEGPLEEISEAIEETATN